MRQLDLFSALQSSTEGIDTEFKSARGGMPGSFWESYSAMANTQGGTIVLGVAEKSTGLVWEGVPDASQLRTVLWGQLNDRHKVSTNLLRDDDVRTVEDEGRQFVVVNVPRASRLQRPDSPLSRPLRLSHVNPECRKKPIKINNLLSQMFQIGLIRRNARW